MIREWLVAYRNELQLTQQEIANDCDITRVYYTQIEGGTRNPSVGVAKKIAEKMGFEWTIFFKEECNVKKQINNSKLAG